MAKASQEVGRAVALPVNVCDPNLQVPDQEADPGNGGTGSPGSKAIREEQGHDSGSVELDPHVRGELRSKKEAVVNGLKLGIVAGNCLERKTEGRQERRAGVTNQPTPCGTHPASIKRAIGAELHPRIRRGAPKNKRRAEGSPHRCRVGHEVDLRVAVTPLRGDDLLGGNQDLKLADNLRSDVRSKERNPTMFVAVPLRPSKPKNQAGYDEADMGP